jgi:Abortive infection alpha
VRDLANLGPGTAAAAIGATAVAREFHELVSRICYPFAEQFGLWFRDVVIGWRINNFVEEVHKAKKLREEIGDSLHAHPRMINDIFEKGSWVDEPDLQDMWAGLLASSCTEDGKDQSNLIYSNILGQMTGGQAKILNYACQKSRRSYLPSGWVKCDGIHADAREVMGACQISDLNQFDIELDHMNVLGLVKGGFPAFARSPDAIDLEPTTLALNLYVRCQGLRKTPLEYFGDIDRKSYEAGNQPSTTQETP